MSKTLRLVFLASLVLNIILLGVIVGHLPRSLNGAPSRRQQMEQALQNLPDPIEARFREKFQQIRAAGDRCESKWTPRATRRCAYSAPSRLMKPPTINR